MRLLAPFFIALILFGCSDDDDHPPVQACSGTECHGPPILGGGEPSGNGEGGGAGESSELPVFSVTRFESDDFVTSAAFDESAAIRADGKGGTTLKASWNGLDPFAIDGLTDEPFVLIEPTTSGTDALPTLLAPVLKPSVELPLVRESVVEAILSLSSQPLDLDSDRAQIVLTLVDVNRQERIAGATVTEGSADSVLYSASGSWSDAVSETDVTGLALIANVEASAWPGKLTSVAVSGSATGAIPLRVVSGAVTVLYVGIKL